ncbi:hypothetical protein U9M48_037140, partial [Paspalum notatum var. saurae]
VLPLEYTYTSTIMSAAVAVVITFVILVLSSIFRLLSRRKPLNLPPGPRGWPLIGSLGLLAGELPPHRALAALAARHGPLMHLRLGSFDTVVASSAETARLVLKTHNLAFADRPPTAMGIIMAYGYKGILLTPYGPYWRMARKLCATELFSARRVDSFELLRAQEMRSLTRGLFESTSTAIVVKEHLLNFTMQNILRMAVGEKWSGFYGSKEGEAFRYILEEAFAVTGAVNNIGQWLPWLGRLDLQGFLGRMKRVHELFDQFSERILNEHEKDRRRCAEAGGEFVATDLVDVLLQLAEENDAQEEPEARLTRDGVKAIILDIIVRNNLGMVGVSSMRVCALSCVLCAFVARMSRHGRWARRREAADPERQGVARWVKCAYAEALQRAWPTYRASSSLGAFVAETHTVHLLPPSVSERVRGRVIQGELSAFGAPTIIAGGTETSAVTMEWALAELLRHPDAMAAATAELYLVVGRGRWVTERDLPALPYLDAVLKETMRLHPVAPLLFPHRASDDTVVGGYDVPADARVLVNVWAVARDPASWPDAPAAFRPERFLAGGGAENIDVRGAHFELLPFGAGRRMCPAYHLAMKEVAAALANMVHGFAWRLPDGVAPEDVSMEEFLGLTMCRKVPLVAVAEARLPAHLYNMS